MEFLLNNLEATDNNDASLAYMLVAEEPWGISICYKEKACFFAGSQELVLDWPEQADHFL